MDQEYAAFKEAFVQSLTPEDLAALSPEERVAGLSQDGVRRAAEDLLRALTPEERRRLLERLVDEDSRSSGQGAGE